MRALLLLAWAAYTAYHAFVAMNASVPLGKNFAWLEVGIGAIMLTGILVFSVGRKWQKQKRQIALSLSGAGIGLALLGYGLRIPGDFANVLAVAGVLLLSVGFILIGIIEREITKLESFEREERVQGMLNPRSKRNLGIGASDGPDAKVEPWSQVDLGDAPWPSSGGTRHTN